MAIAGMALREYGGIGWHFAFRQWGYLDNNISYIFPISFSEKAYGANATHLGTNNNTPIIIRAIDKNHIEIGVGGQSGPYLFLL